MNSRSKSLSTLLICLLFGLSACGGGGSAPSQTPTPTPTPVPPASSLAITGVSPLGVKAGDRITVTGSGLLAVKRALLGGVEVTVTQDSDSQLTLVVPANAKSGMVQLESAGATVLSTQTVAMAGEPTVTRLNPRVIYSSSYLKLIGANLDLVKEVRLNGKELSIYPYNKKDTEIQVYIEKDSRSGSLTLHYGNNQVLTLPQPITVETPVSVARITPAQGQIGSVIEIEGEGLDGIQDISFHTDKVSALAKPEVVNSQKLRVTVPVDAVSAELTLREKNGRISDNSQSFTVLQTIAAKDMVPRAGQPGQIVTVKGRNLDRVATVTVNKVAVSIASREQGSLTFALPAGGGEVVLQGSGVADVIAGVVTDVNASAAGKPVVAIARVEVGQTYLQAPGEGYQRLVPGKQALLRVFVAGRDGTASPEVQVTGKANGKVLGFIQLTGPSKLMAVPQASALDQTFTTKLPASWIQEDLSLEVAVDPLKKTTTGASETARPVVGRPTNLTLTLVPLKVEERNLTGLVPDLATVRTLLGKVLPIAETNISVDQRAEFLINGGFDWDNTLDKLTTLREAEGNERNYYGLVPDADFPGGTAGLGWVTSPGEGGSRASIGLDTRSSGHLKTMVHELGHNMGRPHAPCGGAADPDKKFPYSEGGLGDAIIYDNVAGVIAQIEPNKAKDIMGYCGGEWFSDYGYAKVQAHLESWLYPSASAMQAYSVKVELLEVTGRIDKDGVKLKPVGSSFGIPTRPIGEYELKLYLKDGSQLVTSFNVVEVADSTTPWSRFSVKLVKPSAEIDRIEILKAGKVLPQIVGRAAARYTSNEAAGVKLTWHENAGKLSFTWDDSRFRYLTLVHLGRAKTLVGVDIEGGKGVVDISRVPSGGEWEVIFSDGLNTRRITAKR
ncbi:IPT/TIG domain-containing protein [Chitinimonas sp. PSY-7]|uniref:IPT/TIG domain-containing protein n=1 Tax=Chitinimonas sp. PSY-7 TaxID=3459088 RepID=UPI00403FD771